MGNGLRDLRTEHGWTHQRAADEVGLSRSQFIKLERGERGLTERTIGLAAKAFGASRARVLGDAQVVPEAAVSSPIDELPNARRADGADKVDLTRLRGPRNVPVKGTGVGGEKGDFRFNGQTIDHVARPPGIEGKLDVYVVYIVGDSMAPRYEDGDPAYIDPHRRPKVRDYVVVELRGPSEDEPGEAFVKRLVSRAGGKIVVEQHNPAKVLTFDEVDVAEVHRVIPWTELIGI